MNKGITYSLLFSVMIMWGLNVVAVKLLVDYFPPVFMQGLRVFIAGLVLFMILFTQKELRKLTKREWKFTFLASVFGQLLHHGLLAIGLTTTTASNSALILGLIPISTAILAIIFLKDVLTKMRLFGIILGFIGVAIVILQSNDGVGIISRGDLFVLIAMLAQAGSFILVKKATVSLNAKLMTTMMLLSGSMLLLITGFIMEPNVISGLNHVPMWIWLILLSSAILATGAGHIFYNLAINQIGTSQTAIFNNLVPFFALVGSFLFLGESIFFTQVMAFLLIVCGVILGTGYIDSIIAKRKQSRNRMYP